MHLINRETDYAVRALCYLARHPRDIVPVARLCAEAHTPRPYLRRILQTLAKAGMLDSFRGKGGGFRLRKSVSGIRLADVMEIFQGNPDFTRCVFRNKVCPRQSTCPLRKKIKAIEKRAVAELRATTIASLI